jgi:hypothetical protein
MLLPVTYNFATFFYAIASEKQFCEWCDIQFDVSNKVSKILLISISWYKSESKKKSTCIYNIFNYKFTNNNQTFSTITKLYFTGNSIKNVAKLYVTGNSIKNVEIKLNITPLYS